jgi:nitrogen fixation/metabolism regulation signal transduction histidine kinase
MADSKKSIHRFYLAACLHSIVVVLSLTTTDEYETFLLSPFVISVLVPFVVSVLVMAWSWKLSGSIIESNASIRQLKKIGWIYSVVVLAPAICVLLLSIFTPIRSYFESQLTLVILWCVTAASFGRSRLLSRIITLKKAAKNGADLKEDPSDNILHDPEFPPNKPTDE